MWCVLLVFFSVDSISLGWQVGKVGSITLEMFLLPYTCLKFFAAKGDSFLYEGLNL